ncbi:MAG: hypothetical protein WDO74_21070 [Pseudomonadota bacterium]
MVKTLLSRSRLPILAFRASLVLGAACVLIACGSDDSAASGAGGSSAEAGGQAGQDAEAQPDAGDATGGADATAGAPDASQAGEPSGAGTPGSSGSSTLGEVAGFFNEGNGGQSANNGGTGNGGTGDAEANTNNGGTTTNNGGTTTNNGGTTANNGGTTAGGANADNGGTGNGGTAAGGANGNNGGTGNGGNAAGGSNSCGVSTGGSGGMLGDRCFADRDCPSSNCTGTSTDLLCVPIADACTTDADCDITEYCDGYCHRAAAFGSPCSANGRCGDPGIFCDQHMGLCLMPESPATCSSDSDCPMGIPCRFYGHVGPPKRICLGPGTVGQWCDTNPCGDGLCCTPIAGSFACMIPKTCGITGDAHDCNTFDCVVGQHCDYETATTCINNLSEGSPCTNRASRVQVGAEPCAPGMYCGGDPLAGFFCRKSPGEGEPCVVAAEASAAGHATCTDKYQHGCSPCALGLYCGADGRCAAYARAGEPCANRTCASDLRCTQGLTDGKCANSNSGGDASGGTGGLAGGANGSVGTNCGSILHFPNVAVEQAVRVATGIWYRDLVPADVANTGVLYILDLGSGDLTGIECLPNLALLDLTGSGIHDLGPLAGANNLTQLRLHATNVRDMTPLAGLTKFNVLFAEATAMADLRSLSQNPALKSLTIYGDLDCSAQEGAVFALRARGVNVSVSCPLNCDLQSSGDDIATSIDKGFFDACAVLNDGRVKCWDGNRTDSFGPAIVSGISNAVQVSVGSKACAVMADKSVACWSTKMSDGSQGAAFPNFAKLVAGLAGVRQVVVAQATPACALLVDGSVKCWGSNYFAGLGNGDPSITESDAPTPVVGLSDVVALSAGEAHLCALRRDGRVWCWGDNLAQQLGGTTEKKSYVPVAVPGLSDVAAVSAGAYHSCALRNDGSVWCWGSFRAQSGNAAPTRIEGLCEVVAISSGEKQTCVLLKDGRVQCWGAAQSLSGLGDGSNVDSDTPVFVKGVSSAIALTADEVGGCVVLASGAVRCWGPVGFGGQVGDCVPGFVPSVPNSGLNSCQINSSSHSRGELDPADACFACEPDFSTSDWTAVPNGSACGSNALCLQGSCAPGCKIDSVAYPAGAENPRQSCQTCRPDQASDRWSDVPSEACVTSIGANGSLGNPNGQTSAARGGVAYVWGLEVRSPTPVAGLASNVTAVAAGADHSCAIAAGAAYCWHHNSYGQLGDGSTTDSEAPILALNPSSAVSVGDTHTCAVQNGDAYCWGDNFSGQLGDGSLVNHPQPARVLGLPSPVTRIAATFRNTCAVASGAVYCWGANSSGQLGNGTTVDSSVPTLAPLGGHVIQVAAAGDMACAIADARVWCWGANDYGQLGNGSRVASHVPVAVQNLPGGASDVAVSGVHACAVVDSKLFCWGSNSSGELGNSSYEDSALPVQVDALAPGTASAVAAGVASCAIVDGRAYCWGSNVWGNVGNINAGTANGTVNLPVPVAFP